MESLLRLPSRGNLVAGVAKFSDVTPTKYVCAYDTEPPSHQIIKTDPTNILIRALKQRKRDNEVTPLAQGDVNRKESNTREAKGKRPLPVADSAAAAPERPPKRPHVESIDVGTDEEARAPRNHIASSTPSSSGGAAANDTSNATVVRENELRGMKIEALRNLLKKRGLNTFGRKEDLISRLMAATFRNRTEKQPR